MFEYAQLILFIGGKVRIGLKAIIPKSQANSSKIIFE